MPLKAACILLLAAVCTPPVYGQRRHYSIVMAHGNADTCGYAVDAINKSMETIPFPNKWKFVVACDEAAWEDMNKHIPMLRDTHHALTNVQAHFTIVRGEMFKRDIDGFHARHILIHEYAHVLNNSPDERKAIKRTKELEKKGM